MQNKSDSAVEDNDDVDKEELNEDGVLFYVNKGGFPIDDFTWQRMWKYAEQLHPDASKMISVIRINHNLNEVLLPQAPTCLSPKLTLCEQLNVIQNYMSTLQYNHTGTQFFEVLKNRPLTRLMDLARGMIEESLPIKCLEAVILAIYLTTGISNLERFPISFTSKLMSTTHRHVVLGVYYGGLYGALGMSRRADFMFKPLKFKSLSQLIRDYESCYTRYGHQLIKVKVGLFVPHMLHSCEKITWKRISLTIGKLSDEEFCSQIKKHSRDMRAQALTRVALSGPAPQSPLMTSGNGKSSTTKSKKKKKRSIKKLTLTNKSKDSQNEKESSRESSPEENLDNCEEQLNQSTIDDSCKERQILTTNSSNALIKCKSCNI